MAFIEVADVFRRSYEQAQKGKQPAAAWLGDPTYRHESRYWDGERWTEWVADQGVQATDAVDLGQGGGTWSDRFENATIEALRTTEVIRRLGVSEPELRALAVGSSEAARLVNGWPLAMVDLAAVERAVQLLRTPRSAVTGKLDRMTQEAMYNQLYPELMATGSYVALVHCAKCRAVQPLTFDPKGKCYRCPAHHLFVVRDVAVVPAADAEQVRAQLAAGPARKGGRPLI